MNSNKFQLLNFFHEQWKGYFPHYMHHHLFQPRLCPYAYFPKTYLNIILPSSCGSSRWSLFKRIPHPTSVYTSYFWPLQTLSETSFAKWLNARSTILIHCLYTISLKACDSPLGDIIKWYSVLPCSCIYWQQVCTLQCCHIWVSSLQISK